MKLFKKKKAYIIKWTRDLRNPEECHETVVLSHEESYAVSKFLRCHRLEKIEVLEVKEVTRV